MLLDIIFISLFNKSQQAILKGEHEENTDDSKYGGIFLRTLVSIKHGQRQSSVSILQFGSLY